MSALNELPGREEPLDPELEDYLEESEHFGWQMIRHPLVYSVPHFDNLNAMVNQQLADKRAAVERARDAKDWHHYVFLHERPYRREAFEAVMDEMPDGVYWTLLARIWIDSENIRQDPGPWWELFEVDRPDRWRLMNREDRLIYNALPERVTVWQGCTTERDDGWSWTTQRQTAEWFAQRFANLEGSKPVLRHGWVDKENVIAFFARRGESEALIRPEHVNFVVENRLVPTRTMGSIPIVHAITTNLQGHIDHVVDVIAERIGEGSDEG